LSEILLRSDFTDFAPISRVILQLKASIDDSLAQDALGFVLSAIGAATTEMGAVNDGATGFPSIGKIRSLAASAGDMSKALSEKFASLLCRICVRERLTLALTGADAEFGERIVDIFPSGEVKESQKVNTTGKRELGLAVPSEVGYAALGGLSAPACEKNGIFRVVRSILSFDFLWNKIRIKGGAYGTGFVARRSGELMLYSYRDPSPYQSVKVYGECADYLRSLAKSGADITKFIVGAIGEYDRLMTPRTLSAQATYDILTGWSADKEKKLREDMLSTTLGDLEWAADVIENIYREGVTVIAHDKSSLKEANICEITEP
jgi:Zn-dependent M16 (insulinase) family peptidase